MKKIMQIMSTKSKNLRYEADPSHALCALELEHTWLLFVHMIIMITMIMILMMMMIRRRTMLMLMMMLMMMMMMLMMTWKKK